MKILNTLYIYLEGKDRIFFYKIMGALLGGLLLSMIAIFFQYHRRVTFLKKRISTINELREDARIIREKAQHVQNQRTAVDTMLAEDRDFKIGGYFNELLSKIVLTNKKSSEETSQLDREDNYRESELTAQLVDISMKQLTEMLYEIEQKKRIYIKKLEIEKSKKTSKSIDITITIATLLPKTE